MAAKADAVIALPEAAIDEPKKPRKVNRDEKPVDSDTKPARRSVAKKADSANAGAPVAAPEKAAVKRVRKPIVPAGDAAVKPDVKE